MHLNLFELGAFNQLQPIDCIGVEWEFLGKTNPELSI